MECETENGVRGFHRSTGQRHLMWIMLSEVLTVDIEFQLWNYGPGEKGIGDVRMRVEDFASYRIL